MPVLVVRFVFADFGLQSDVVPDLGLQAVSEFQQEAERMQSIRHPNLVSPGRRVGGAWWCGWRCEWGGWVGE